MIRKRGVKVHVICGGGSGSEIISRLHNEGFDISSGVLAIGDLDWKISKENDVQLAEEVPFVGISGEAYKRNLELASQADVIILAGLYIGKSNIRNIELLYEKELLDKPLMILEDGSFKERDYSNGSASELYERIRAGSNAVLVERIELIEEILKAVEANGEK
jgi:iron complex transport system ATP-binding protein